MYKNPIQEGSLGGILIFSKYYYFEHHHLLRGGGDKRFKKLGF